MDKPYAIGVDVGGTNTVVGIVDKRGQILINGSIKTAKHTEVENYLDELTKLIDELISKITTKDQIKGIGAGTPNGNYFTGSIEFAPNLPWKGVIPFAQMLEDRTGIPVALTNDANAAAIGEIVINNQTGHLVEPRNTEAMAKAILQTIEDKEQTQVYVENAYDLIIKECDPQNYAKKLISLYEEL